MEAALPELDAKCFIAMRYWHPFSLEAARAVQAWAPDEVVLLPLYPQYSTTTTGSSLTAWREAAARSRAGHADDQLCAAIQPTLSYVAATAALVRMRMTKRRAALRSAIAACASCSRPTDCPEMIVQAGDPYQWQIEQTVAARAGGSLPGWITVGSATSRAPRRSNGSVPARTAKSSGRRKDGVAVLVVPIAFVSEHTETLVELDVDYRDAGGTVGVPGYFRVPTQNADAGFIAALAGLVRRARGDAGPGPAASRAGASARRHRDFVSAGDPASRKRRHASAAH